MDSDELRADPDEQRERGLSPEEQREERDRESEATEKTKYELFRDREGAEREQVAERLQEEPLGGEEGK